MVVAESSKLMVSPLGVVYGSGAKLIDVGAVAKMSAPVVKVPVKPAMAACRGARYSGGVAEVIVVPAPTVRIVFVGLLMLLLPTGLP